MADYDSYTEVSLMRAIKAQLGTINPDNGYLIDIRDADGTPRIYTGDTEPFAQARPALFVYTTDQGVREHQPADFYDLPTMYFVDCIAQIPENAVADEYLMMIVAEIRRCLQRGIEFQCVKQRPDNVVETFMQPARIAYKGRSMNFGPPMPGVGWVETKFQVIYRDFSDDPRKSG